MKKVMLLHGVNHNMFGKRDPKQYGTITLDEINKKVNDLAEELGIEVTNFQTNNEGEFIGVGTLASPYYGRNKFLQLTMNDYVKLDKEEEL